MQQYANVSSVPLSLAVFLATDNYDYVDTPDYISVTSLMKPVRQLILASRVPPAQSAPDLESMISSRMGSAIHDAIENSWKNNHVKALKALGYPERIIQRIRINPTKEELTQDIIPVYLEQRAYKKVGKYTIGGKYDFIGEGRVEDFKSTSTYTATSKNKDDDYILQGSLYRWLNPDLVTRDEMAIQFIFTDWSAARAKTDPTYPQKRTQERVLKLKSITETDAYVRRKLALIEQYWDADEKDIPECADGDLWRTDPIYKYYKNKEKLGRSTKNFENKQDAYDRLAIDGGTGVVMEHPGQVKACLYCQGYSMCTQKDRLIQCGDLIAS